MPVKPMFKVSKFFVNVFYPKFLQFADNIPAFFGQHSRIRSAVYLSRRQLLDFEIDEKENKSIKTILSRKGENRDQLKAVVETSELHCG